MTATYPTDAPVASERRAPPAKSWEKPMASPAPTRRDPGSPGCPPLPVADPGSPTSSRPSSTRQTNEAGWPSLRMTSPGVKRTMAHASLSAATFARERAPCAQGESRRRCSSWTAVAGGT